MKKIIVKHIQKKYNLKEEFVKRILKKDFNIIDILKIDFILNKEVFNHEKHYICRRKTNWN